MASRELWKVINRHNFLDKVVLDLGCGPGFRLEKILKDLPKQILAIDINKEMFQRAKDYIGKINNLDYICADYSNLPIKDESVDIVLSTYANFFKQDIKTRLEEVYRVLKTGGELTIVSTVHNNFDKAQNIILQYYEDKFQYVRLTNPFGLVTLIAKK